MESAGIYVYVILFYVWCCMLLCVYPVCAPLGVSPVSQAWKFVPPLQAVASVPREEAKQMALPDLDDAGQTHKQSQHQRSSSVGPLTRSNSVVRNQLTYIICYMFLFRLIFYVMSMISRIVYVILWCSMSIISLQFLDSCYVMLWYVYDMLNIVLNDIFFNGSRILRLLP